MTRNERRAQNRRKIRISDTPPTLIPKHLAIGASTQTRKAHKPRNTWHQRGWSDTSPYYFNLTTIDRRWDK